MDKLPAHHPKQPDPVPDVVGESGELEGPSGGELLLEGPHAASSEEAAPGGTRTDPTPPILKTPAYILLAVDGTWR